MSAVSYSDGNGANTSLLQALLASHQPSQLTAGPTEGLASLMELAAVFKQHSGATAADAATTDPGQQQRHAWQLETATQLLSKPTVNQQMQQRGVHTAVPGSQQPAAEAQQQQQPGPAQIPEPLNHRSSSRRRKPKVACSSAYAPSDCTTNTCDITGNHQDTQQTDLGHTMYDGQALQIASLQGLAAAVGGDQHHGYNNEECSTVNHFAEQQHQTGMAQPKRSNGKKRPASNSGVQAATGRSNTPAAAADPPAAAAAALRWSGSGDLSDGTDSAGMLEDYALLADPALDQSSAAAAAAGAAAKPGSSKQERLKEKNRLAQRRFRARQKTILEQMQVRMEVLAKQVNVRGKDLTMLHQENSMLRNIVQEQQKALMSAMVAQQQQDAADCDAAAASARAAAGNEDGYVKEELKAGPAVAGAARGGGSSGGHEQQYQRLQQLYNEHWQQHQQEHYMLAAAAAAGMRG